jgi:ubiquilin
MREQMRTNDVAMRNIETMPGGYNQLRSMFESMNEAISSSGPNAGVNSPSPIAEMLNSLNVTSSGGGAAEGAGVAGERGAQAQAGINETPLPNPWAPSGAPTGLGGGFGSTLGPLAGGVPPGDMIQMMQNPAMRCMLQSVLSNPAMLDMIANQNPQMREVLDSNPAARSVLSNPAFMERMPEVRSPADKCMRMVPNSFPLGGFFYWHCLYLAGLDPRLRQCSSHSLHAALCRLCGTQPVRAGAVILLQCLKWCVVVQMMQAMQALHGGGPAAPGTGRAEAPDISALMGLLGAAGAGAGATGQNDGAPPPDMTALMAMLGAGGAGAREAGGPGGPAGPDMAAMMSMLGSGGAGGVLAIPPVTNPEEAYASQLRQLTEMGFFDQSENIRALQATGGNVNAAVERLLA